MINKEKQLLRHKRNQTKELNKYISKMPRLKEKILEIGGDYVIWSNAPENPILN